MTAGASPCCAAIASKRAAIVCSIAAAAVGLVYLAHHPESEALQRAEAWPFVGPLATAVRERYTPPEPPPDRRPRLTW